MRKVLKMFLWIVVGLVVLALAAVAYIRIAGDDPKVWHIDPEGAKRTGKPNDFVVAPEGGDLVSPIFDEAPEALMSRFRDMALNQPATILLGDSNGVLTFVQRSKLMAYPDYVSVKAVAVEGGSALYIYSRSRYGYGDGGVNKARVKRWLGKL